jgi:4-amino-4-deoxy-L-arabinose transferase-like glycosyltransferase/tetratricopeptide (TPR) repeat protein
MINTVNPRFSSYIRAIPLWVIPLVMALLLLAPHLTIRVPVDGAYYLSLAQNIHNGRGYVDLDWEPLNRGRSLLPWLIATAFKLTNVSVYTAFLTVRLFFVGNIMLSYALGARLFNRWIGLGASLLVLTSVSINMWSSIIHIDHIIPFFMLLFACIVYEGLNRKSLVLLALAGTVLGIGYLGKETALAFLPLPLLGTILITKFRHKRNVWGSVLLYSIVVLFILVPIVANQSANSLETSAVGVGATIIDNRMERFDAIAGMGASRVLRYLQLPLVFYNESMAPYFWLAPLMLVSWFFVIIRAAVKREPGFIFMSILSVLVLPFVVFQVITDYRVRQSFVVFLLSYLAIGIFVYSSADLIARTIYSRTKWGTHIQVVGPVLTLCIVALLSYGQITRETTPDGRFADYFSNYSPSHWFSTDRLTPIVTGVTGEQALVEAGEWLKNNAVPGAVIAGAPDRLRAVYFYSGGNYPAFALFPQEFEWYLTEERMFSRYLQNSKLDGMPDPSEDTGFYTPLLMWTFGRPSLGNFGEISLQMYIEEFLLQSLRDWSVDYVVVTQRSGPLSLYLQQNPSFEKVADFRNGEALIYRVNTLEPADFPLHTSGEARSLLALIQQQVPERYELLTTKVFPKIFGWPADAAPLSALDTIDLQSISSGFDLDIFRGQLAALPDDSLQTTTASLSEQIMLYPENPWPHVYLAVAHEAMAQSNHSQVVHWAEASRHYRLALSKAKDPSVLRAVFNHLPTISLFADAQEVRTALISAYESLNSEALEDPQLSLDLADLYGYSGNLDHKTRLLEQLSALPDQNYDLLLALGDKYGQLGETAQAVAMYNRAITREPGRYAAYSQLATLYHTQEQNDKVLEVFKEAAAANPSASWPLIELSRYSIRALSEIP